MSNLSSDVIWSPKASYVDGQWRGGWRLSQEASDKRDREYLERKEKEDGKVK